MKQIISLLLLLVTFPLSAQFTLSGEFRPRAEYSHGYASLSIADQNPSLFTSQRTRLNLDYKNEMVTTKLVLQDVRLWGGQSQLVSNEDYAVSVHEAWAEFGLCTQSWLRVGRQELIYDNQRIFGNVGWAQQARSHDLALIKYENNINIHLGIAYNENSDRSNNLYTIGNSYKAMQFLWMNKKTENNSLSFLFLNNGNAFSDFEYVNGVAEINQSINYSQTVGFFDAHKNDNLSIEGSVYYQFGEDAIGKTLNAYQLALSGYYSVSQSVGLSVGYELLSGTSYDETVENNSFAPLYGTNHKFNGFMDYFYVGNHSNSVGLQDINFKATYTKGRAVLQTNLHMFSSAEEQSSDQDNYLGTEIDLVAAYKISDVVKLNLGYSHIFESESMELLQDKAAGDTQNWAWLMITVKPFFFTSSK